MSTNITPQYTHLYYEWHRCWDGCWAVINGEIRYVGDMPDHSCWEMKACPITRITAKRIYFRGADNGPLYLREREFFIDRSVIERDGDIYHRGMRELLSLEPPPERWRPTRDEKSLAELRREMADLHPDRGGDPAEFRAAHARYAAAKRVSR